MKRLLVAVLLVPSAFPMNVSAGWFGPSNYEECLISEMRGQSIQMAQVAGAICNKKFPINDLSDKKQEILLNENNNSELKYSICSKGNLTKICIVENPKKNVISRVVGHFSQKSPCSYTPERPASFTEVSRVDGIAAQIRYYDEYKRKYIKDMSEFTNVDGTKNWFSQEYNFNVKPNYSCFYYSIYGYANQ